VPSPAVTWQHSQLGRFFSLCVHRIRSSLVVAYLTTQLGVAWSQSSNKGYSSRPYGSRTALSNRRLKTTNSRVYISQIIIAHKVVFLVTIFTALLGNVSNSGHLSAPGLPSSQAGGSPLLTGKRLSHNELGIATQQLKTIGGPPPTPPSCYVSVSGCLGQPASGLEL
jgi:hypothetical protein